MTTEPTREEVEARLVEAKARLREAEEAHRRVVPCEHRTVSCESSGRSSCADCGAALDDPRDICQHHQIDNSTWACLACGEIMRYRSQETETVMSAPNAAACTNPECSGVDDPACQNPHGLYVPDRSRERVVPIQVNFTYQCKRCQYNGAVFTQDGPIWDCGHDHRGDSIPVRTEEYA